MAFHSKTVIYLVKACVDNDKLTWLLMKLVRRQTDIEFMIGWFMGTWKVPWQMV